MLLSQQVESHRFWEVITQWAADKLQHEHVVARALPSFWFEAGLRRAA